MFYRSQNQLVWELALLKIEKIGSLVKLHCFQLNFLENLLCKRQILSIEDEKDFLSMHFSKCLPTSLVFILMYGVCTFLTKLNDIFFVFYLTANSFRSSLIFAPPLPIITPTILLGIKISVENCPALATDILRSGNSLF